MNDPSAALVDLQFPHMQPPPLKRVRKISKEHLNENTKNQERFQSESYAQEPVFHCKGVTKRYCVKIWKQ